MLRASPSLRSLIMSMLWPFQDFPAANQHCPGTAVQCLCAAPYAGLQAAAWVCRRLEGQGKALHLRHGSGHAALGDCVHGRAHHRRPHPNVAGQLRAEIHLQPRSPPMHMQHLTNGPQAEAVSQGGSLDDRHEGEAALTPRADELMP